MSHTCKCCEFFVQFHVRHINFDGMSKSLAVIKNFRISNELEATSMDIDNSLGNVPVTEFWKLVYVCWSYDYKCMYYFIYACRCYVSMCINRQLDSRMSELLTDSVTKGWCPLIRTDVVARHTAIFHWQSWWVIHHWHCKNIQHCNDHDNNDGTWK